MAGFSDQIWIRIESQSRRHMQVALAMVLVQPAVSGAVFDHREWLSLVRLLDQFLNKWIQV